MSALTLYTLLYYINSDVNEEAVVGDDERESQTSSPSSQASPHSDSAELIRTYLSDLIQIVHTCLDQHLGMQSTVIKDAAKNLTDCYQSKFCLLRDWF